MWKVPKEIICQKQSHIKKLQDVFIYNNKQYKEDEITKVFNTFFTTFVQIEQLR